ncbi:hypothetical protein KFL_005400080 [Klebsormidium nitens]|uniref:Uncharacterized protein n=1 Tax=Klebsormidium nitens TaxID=105231 RepID=A0A1Y1IN99_KLENI|nr:hypothetical protein KFL_005400080 [Klebsormidium nitens]|eukprot:GAQ89598.1 hypothetical protein KFL_005400080 [Klebsormidium nitens]
MADLGNADGQLSSRGTATPSSVSPRSNLANLSDELASQSTPRATASPRSGLTSGGGPKRGPPSPHPGTSNGSEYPPPPPKVLSPIWQQKKLAPPAHGTLPAGVAPLEGGEQWAGRAGQKEMLTRSLPDLKLHLRALAEQDERGWEQGAGSPTLAGLPQYRAILEAEGRPVGTPTGRGAARVKALELEEGMGVEGRMGGGETPKGLEGSPWAGSPHSPAKTLREKASSVRLWHEEAAARSGQVRSVQLLSSPRSPRAKPGSLNPPEVEVDDTPRVYPPISQQQRLEPPPDWRIPERKRSADSGKGGGPQLADFSVLAETSHRLNNPGRTREEARALLSMAVLLENAQRLIPISPQVPSQEYGRAVDVYERFLRACVQSQDQDLQVLAHNCLGIAHAAAGDYVAAKPGSPRTAGLAESLGEEAGCSLPGDAAAEYEAALGHHAQHGDLAADGRGRAMAAGNAGLLLTRLGRGNEAIEMHKRALAAAIQGGDAVCERAAVGNLGRLLLQQDKVLASAEDCIRRYLAVCTSLEDGAGVAEAHFLLGVVATRVGRHATAAGEFEAALAAAKACGNKDIARYARIHIGMAKGKVNLAQQLAALDGPQTQ